MIEDLYTQLRERGVILKTSGNCRAIEYDAPRGVVTDEMRQRLLSCKAEMLDYLSEIEETAAILEIEHGCTPKFSQVLARRMVDHHRMCRSENALFSRARSRPLFMAVESAFFSVFNYGLEIVSVERVAA